MQHRIPKRLQDAERLHSVQVRQPSVRLRGSVAVSVASIAPPPRPSEAASHNGSYSGSSNDRIRLADGAVLRAITPSSTSELGADSPSSIPSDSAAALERAASSGQATTSSPSTAPLPQAGYRRRLVGAAANKASATSAGPPAGRAAASRSFNPNREFQPREFTSQLAAASSLSELELLFEAGRKHDINAIHIATLWTRLAKLVSAPPAVVAAQVAPRHRRPAPVPEPAALLAFVDQLEAATTSEQLVAMAPRGLANVVWAAAKLKPEAAAGGAVAMPAVLSDPAPKPGSSDDSATLPSSEGSRSSGVGMLEGPDDEAATAGPSSSSSSGVGSESPRPARTRRVRGGKAAAAQASEERASEAAEAAAARRLASTVVSESLLDAWAAAAARKLADFSMQDISNVVWALGRLGYQPHGMFMTQLSIALLKELPRADRPQQISNVLLGLALLRYVPPVKDFWPPVWEAVQRLVLADQQEPDVQGVTNTLWALGHLVSECPNSMQPVPAPLISKAVFRAVQYGDRMSASQCQDVFTSLPRLGFEPSEYQASKLLALALRVLPSCDAQALSNILVSLVQLRVQPWPAWKNAARRAFRQQLPSASPEALARFLFAWAHLREAPPLWTPKVWQRLAGEVDALTASDIAFTILGANQMFQRLPRRVRDTNQATEAVEAGAAVEAAEAVEAGAAVEDQGGAKAEADSAASAASSAVVVVEAVEAAFATDASPSKSLGQGSAAEVEKVDDVAEEEAEGAPTRRRVFPLDGGVKARLPPRQLLLALRERWEALGAEAHLSVRFRYRAIVQEVLDQLVA